MVDYKKMYYAVSAASDDAIECINQSQIANASFKLIEGLRLAEQIYIDTSDSEDDE